LTAVATADNGLTSVAEAIDLIEDVNPAKRPIVLDTGGEPAGR
jgi:hypothetical protein